MDIQDLWETALTQFRECVSQPAFTTWFSGTKALSFHDGLLIVGATTTFSKSHLESRFLDLIQEVVTKLVETPIEVQLTVLESQSEVGYQSISPTCREVGVGKFLILVTREASAYRAFVADIPECSALGETRRIAIQRTSDVLQTYLEMVRRDQTSLPTPQTTAEYVLLPLS